jgi:hypothetical protein
MDSTANVAYLMKPKSFVYKNERSDFNASVYAITLIRVSIVAERGDVLIARVSCEAPYVGTSVLFAE